MTQRIQSRCRQAGAQSRVVLEPLQQPLQLGTNPLSELLEGDEELTKHARVGIARMLSSSSVAVSEQALLSTGRNLRDILGPVPTPCGFRQLLPTRQQNTRNSTVT